MAWGDIPVRSPDYAGVGGDGYRSAPTHFRYSNNSGADYMQCIRQETQALVFVARAILATDICKATYIVCTDSYTVYKGAARGKQYCSKTDLTSTWVHYWAAADQLVARCTHTSAQSLGTHYRRSSASRNTYQA